MASPGARPDPAAAGRTGAQSRAAAVQARQLEVAYGTRLALCDADFTIPDGALTVLIGSNGSGKSTLMNAVAGLVEPSSGELSVLGAAGPARPGQAAYVLQSTQTDALLPISVEEVVTMARFSTRGFVGRLDAADRRAVAGAMERMEISDIASRRVSQLSGGQHQRVLVAQGLAQDAEILLLDEPVTGLDLVSRRRIVSAILEERDTGRCIVLASHDLDDARIADHVVLLAGRVVAEGAADVALARENLRAAYGHRHLDLEDGGRAMVDDRHGHGWSSAGR
ncbi:MAG: metal ABC transporter ATP-binding protein [Gaiellales bacterium]